MAKKMTVRATLAKEFTVTGDLDESKQQELTDRFLVEANEDGGADDIQFEVVGEETVEMKRGSREIMEEWQGVCSEALDDKGLIDALAIFIDKQGKAEQLDEFLRKLADEGMSDPAAE